MSTWDQYTKDAEVSEGGSYPVIDDDLYAAMVQDVSEPTEEPNKFKAKDSDPDMVTRFYITWELTSDNVPENTTLRQYITLPEAYLSDGYLNEKSNLHKVMTALGFDLTGRFRVAPAEWNGMEARVMVECPRDADGTQTGWPRITGVKPKRASAAPAKKQPVAAGAAPARRSKAEDWAED